MATNASTIIKNSRRAHYSNVSKRADGLALLIGDRVGQYALRKHIADTNYGTKLYIAEVPNLSPGSSSLVVIKIRPISYGANSLTLRRLNSQFKAEYEITKALKHPNIIRALEHGTDVDRAGCPLLFTVFTYIDGVDLANLIQRPLPFNLAFNYLQQICAAIAHAHDQGVTHRDLKPANLMLGKQDSLISVLDFGAAAWSSAECDYLAGLNVGTRTYGAPEQFDQMTRISASPMLDVYGLGKTTFELITGIAPRHFKLKPISEFPFNVAAQRWATPVLDVLRRATDNDPRKRQRSVQEFWEQLRVAASSRIPAVESETTSHHSKAFVSVSRVSQSNDEARQQVPPVKQPSTRVQRRIVSNRMLLLLAVLLLTTLHFSRCGSSDCGSTTQRERSADDQSDAQDLCKGVTTTDVNLRASGNADSSRVGLAEHGSRVCVLRVRGDWADVMVIQHGREKADANSADQGWLNLNFVTFDR